MHRVLVCKRIIKRQSVSSARKSGFTYPEEERKEGSKEGRKKGRKEGRKSGVAKDVCV